MNRLFVIVLALLAVVLPQSALAAPYDGSSPLLCSVTGVMDCAHKGECHRVSPDEVSFPPFLRIDTKAATMSTIVGAPTRSAPIQRTEVVDAGLLLYGGQEGRAWSARIAGDTGKMSAGVVDSDGGFMIFGHCVPLAQ